MATETITVADYELAERQLLNAASRSRWRRHASVFAVAAVALVILEVLTGIGGLWPYLALSVWAVVLYAHYVGAVRHGDAHLREQQIRIEWRAGRSNERLIPKT